MLSAIYRYHYLTSADSVSLKEFTHENHARNLRATTKLTSTPRISKFFNTTNYLTSSVKSKLI